MDFKLAQPNQQAAAMHNDYMDSFGALSDHSASGMRDKAFQNPQNSNVSADNFKERVVRDSEERNTFENATRLGLKYADMRKIIVEDESLKLIPKEDALNSRSFPIALKNGHFFLGAVDPTNEKFTTLLKRLNEEHDVVLALVSASSFEEIAARYEKIVYDDEEKLEQGTVRVDQNRFANLKGLEDALSKDGIQNLLSDLLGAATQIKCSDIHIEPHGEGAEIRARIDGVLHHVARIPKDRYNYLLSEIIINSSLQMDVNVPQNGHLRTMDEDSKGNVDIRVETIPVIHGQEVVMRFFQKEAKLLKLSELGITKDVYPIIKDILFRPYGMVVVVGPTGSGKSSTLYALINELNTPERKIVTLEDPVEYELPGISQSQVGKDESFSERFKAVLREDPDIVMVGEVRDIDTAKTALQSALTGHLLLTTFHANNAAVAIARLTDMVGDTALISSAINLIVAQRLVRKICPYCRTEATLNADEAAAVQSILEHLPGKYREYAREYRFYKGTGCDRCFNMGFKGRIGIFEMLRVTTDIQQLIMQKSLPSAIQATAVKNGMLTMEQDGILKAMLGLTTVNEVLTTVKE